MKRRHHVAGTPLLPVHHCCRYTTVRYTPGHIQRDTHLGTYSGVHTWACLRGTHLGMSERYTPGHGGRSTHLGMVEEYTPGIPPGIYTRVVHPAIPHPPRYTPYISRSRRLPRRCSRGCAVTDDEALGSNLRLIREKGRLCTLLVLLPVMNGRGVCAESFRSS